MAIGLKSHCAFTQEFYKLRINQILHCKVLQNQIPLNSHVSGVMLNILMYLAI